MHDWHRVWIILPCCVLLVFKIVFLQMKLLILLRRAAVVGIFVRGSTLFERFQRRSMFPRLLRMVYFWARRLLV